MKMIEFPKEGEYPPYAMIYLRLLPQDGRVLKHLKDNMRATKELMLGIPEEKLLYRYAEDKWTIKEVMVHIVDDERIYAYRALRFARNDSTELPGFEQNGFTQHSDANKRSMRDILREYTAVRNATIELFRGLQPEALLRGGVANKNFATVRALAYHIAGHELHHINIIQEKYLPQGL